MPPSASEPTTSAHSSSTTPWWLWPQMLSLEAPLIAVLWMAALAHTHSFRLPITFYWGLFLATWVVYILDRVGDASESATATALTERHAFHHQHRRFFLWGVLPLCSILLIWAALWEIPESLAIQGLGLVLLGAIYLASYSSGTQSLSRKVLLGVAFVSGLLLVLHLSVPLAFRLSAVLTFGFVLYLAAQHTTDERWRIALPKELLASLLFVLGCSAGVHFWCGGEHGLVCYETLLLWGLAAANMTTISYSETLHHLPAAESSIAQKIPQASRFMPVILMGLACVSGTSLIQSLLGRDNRYIAGTSAYVLLSSLALLALQCVIHRLRPSTFRTLADFALLAAIPVFWLVDQ